MYLYFYFVFFIVEKPFGLWIIQSTAYWLWFPHLNFL